MNSRFALLSGVAGAALLMGCGSKPTPQDDTFFKGLQSAQQKTKDGSFKSAPKAGPRSLGEVIARHKANGGDTSTPAVPPPAGQ